MFNLLVSVIICAIATEEVYGPALYVIMPNMAPPNGTELTELQARLPVISPGEGRTAREQASSDLVISIMSVVRKDSESEV